MDLKKESSVSFIKQKYRRSLLVSKTKKISKLEFKIN